jgi:hypothetical protein
MDLACQGQVYPEEGLVFWSLVQVDPIHPITRYRLRGPNVVVQSLEVAFQKMQHSLFLSSPLRPFSQF